MSTPHQSSQTDGKGGLKIIGAGFGRTGTLSLKHALEELGFGPCYHMIEVFGHPNHGTYWLAAARKELRDWNAIFSGFQATVDWPSCTFYAELIQVYPDARVILTLRDPEKWHDSVMHTIYNQGLNSPFARMIMAVLGILVPSARALRKMQKEIIWDGTFHGRTSEKEYALSIFQQHNEEVQRLVPPEKLLVYQVSEGWGPLCDFLGVPVPTDKPFPHVNDRENFNPERLSQMPFFFRVVARLRSRQRARSSPPVTSNP